MKKIHFLGECMVELRAGDASTMHQSFAGDVYNSAVYLKRVFPEVATSIVTAVGQDNLSDKMVATFEQEYIDTKYVFRHESKVAGLYLVETDETGERSFTYWRSDAAARKVVDFLNSDVLAELATGDMFFFSGISLAVIEEDARSLFWEKLELLKNAGIKLVFDPNYRARLWRSEEQAKEQFERALNVSDIALPGVEDLTELYGVDSAQGVIDFCRPFGLQELVIKNGPGSVVTFESETLLTHKITPVTNVVDTTSAGDAFNGVYLGARLTGQAVSESVQLAAKAAGIVIQHPGAICPVAAFDAVKS
ncbi:sugar kinase [Psychrosphaera sp. B3R10]|uniref:sugar kinase n=1 Tax=unclassified Psychrosphaera TaxID=2641570 RepID=UPI001C09C3E1|nr:MULTISPECIES: sugar kinase [unclassified Psychrosphaera]MBU2881720.1 sugar kinase [Psychrosphaera sp. I2R16]MBU2990095.1 sugar kinase [Psychrosphaera sp. B3R10]